MNATFQANLAFGQVAETRIARYFRARGNQVLPIYDIEYETGKGPRLFGVDALVAPDALVFGKCGIFWAECKHKSVFTWHRLTSRWTTGIDLRHYREYVKVAGSSRCPVWLFFLHCRDTPTIADIRYGCPPRCPTGLFGGEISDLANRVSHQSDRWGRSGMIYWAIESLRLICPLHEIPE